MTIENGTTTIEINTLSEYILARIAKLGESRKALENGEVAVDEKTANNMLEQVIGQQMSLCELANDFKLVDKSALVKKIYG